MVAGLLFARFQQVRRHLVALWWAIRVEMSIRRKPLGELCRTSGIELQEQAGPRGPSPTQLRLSPQDVLTLLTVRRIYKRWPFGRGSCLRECLVDGRLLRYRNPTLCIGVRRVPSGFDMHAWLDLDGAPLDPDHAEYLQLSGGSRPL